MTTEQEASALLVVAIQKKKLDAYDYLKHLSRVSPDDLKMCGYRNMTNAEAVLESLKRCDAEIEKMIQKHEREYP